MWQQRSVDTCLGLPYDLLSYSVFLHLVAQCVDMVPYEVICCLGDTHIYKNHFEQVKLQLSRTPRALPTMNILRKAPSIFDYKYEDFELTGYDPYPAIKAQVSV